MEQTIMIDAAPGSVPHTAPSSIDPMDPGQNSSLKHWCELPAEISAALTDEACVDCGWGRLIFAQTFSSPERLAEEIRKEAPGRRDVALYIRDPHVVVALAPQQLFLDPSHTFRIPLQNAQAATEWNRPPHQGVRIRSTTPADEAEVNRIYLARSMVPVREGFFTDVENETAVSLLVAEDADTGAIIGAVTGVDHVVACNDPDHGSSLWSLAVDPQCVRPGVGETLVRALVAKFRALGRNYLDLSVMHDNAEAIALYEKLGFERVPVYCVKHKNPINEKLFVGPDSFSGLNIYARILVNEARRRGIGVEVIDAEHGYFKLSHGGRAITCRESLSELTSAVAMSRCDDKRVTRNLLTAAGLRMPEQMLARDDAATRAFLAEHGRVVVKPARGEQGHGVRVDLRSFEEVKSAIEAARRYCEDVILEELVPGADLRIVVIDYQVVAAATRRPAQITGDGENTVRALIEKQSRRRQAATAGESSIPLDSETIRTVQAAGHRMDDVLAAGEVLVVRKTANLHTGGTIHDVTPQLNPTLAEVAVRAARALEIPVVGLDLMVPKVEGEEYAIIEANERPGLANHEPQPTAERFVDLLFPQTRTDH
jgi:GNAT-family acetyltransferase (TIGR03103 family)